MILPGPNNPFFRTARLLTCMWIAALVLLLYPYSEDPAGPIKHLASAIAAIALTTVWAAGVVSGKAPFRPPGAPLYALLAFLAVLVLSAGLSESRLRAFDALQPWFGATLIAFVASQVFSEVRHLRNLFRTIVFSVALSSLYGFVQHAGLDPFPWADRAVEEYRGLPATYGNPNLAGHALAIALVLCAGLMADAWPRRKRPLEPLAYALAGAAMLAHLYLSGMRGGVVALAFGSLFAFAGIVATRRGATPVRAGLTALAVTGAVFGVVVATGVMLTPSLHLDSAIQLRLHGYAGAAALFLDNPVFGIGTGNYAAHNIAYWSDFEALWYALENKRNFHVHNEWLEIAVAAGVPGLIAFSALVLFAVMAPFTRPGISSGRSRALPLALATALVVMAVDACTGFNLHVPVSGALFIVLAVQQPGAPHTLAGLRGFARLLPPLLVLLAIAHGAATWRQFQSARLYQQAQGALEWAREQRATGRPEMAAHGVMAARNSLASAFARTPYDYKIPMLAGDLELEQGDHAKAIHYADAIYYYKQALMASFYLPRIKVQLARCYIRVATEVASTTRGLELDMAASFAADARERCPELAEAWAMTGWANYFHAEPQEDDAAFEHLTRAVDAFEQARRLGLADDTQLNAALGTVYRRLGNATMAATLLEHCALAAPGQAAYWDRFAAAAAEAGGDWPVRYRQALLFAIGEGTESLSHGTLDDLATRLSECSVTPASAALARAVLEALLRRHPERLARWGAWLATVEATNRPEALAALLESFRTDVVQVPEAVLALSAALAVPEAAQLDSASTALFQSMATAPGGERRGAIARAFVPLLDQLDRAMAEAQRPAAATANGQIQRGAAWFEAGDPRKAEALLGAAEVHVPAGERALAQYYRSRALLALEQSEAALALAQQAARPADAPPEYGWQLARCLAATGQPDAASFLYASLIARLPAGHPYTPLLQAARDAVQPAAREGAP